MNPPTAPPPSSSGGRVVVVQGGSGGVPFHEHPSGLVARDLPDRLQHPAHYEAHDAANMLETGWWSAHILTANMPYSSQWVCQTILSGADLDLAHLVQIAWDVESPYRVYRRNLQVITWSDWVPWDGLWESYTPVWAASANPTIGNGTLAGSYGQVGQTVTFRIQLTWGSTTTAGTGNWSFSLPVAAHAAYTANMTLGSGLAVDVSAPSFAPLVGGILSSTTIYVVTAAGTILAPTVPYTWATGDKVSIEGSYEAA